MIPISSHPWVSSHVLHCMDPVDSRGQGGLDDTIQISPTCETRKNYEGERDGLEEQARGVQIIEHDHLSDNSVSLCMKRTPQCDPKCIKYKNILMTKIVMGPCVSI